MEQGVGGQGLAAVDAGAPERLAGWTYDLSLFPPDGAGFPSVRVEAGDREAWPGDPEVLGQGAGGDQGRGGDALGREQLRHLAQRLVDGDQGGLQVLRGQHHDGTARLPTSMALGQFAQELRVAWKFEARRVEGRLADRRRDHASDGARQSQARGGLDPADHRRGVGRGGLAGHHRSLHGKVEHRQRTRKRGGGLLGGRDALQLDPAGGRRASQQGMVADDEEGLLAVPGRRPRLDDDLRADPGRIAHGDGEDGPRHGVSMVAEFRRSRR